MRTLTTIALLISVTLIFGCGGDPARPTDLPKLYPCEITVTQEGQPLAEATVTLVSKTPSKYGACSATTDASGVAVLRTYGFDGVPTGRYSVTISKTGVEGAREEKTLEGNLRLAGGKIYSYVDLKFSDDAKPPYEISVTEKGVKETFDAGMPVHVLLRNNE